MHLIDVTFVFHTSNKKCNVQMDSDTITNLPSLGTLNEEVEKKDQPKEAPMPNLAWSTRSQFVSINSSLFNSSMIEWYMPSSYSHKVDIFRSKEMMKWRKHNG